MTKERILIWETVKNVSGGQKMSLMVMDLLKDRYEFCCLIPAEGMLAEELKKRGISYVLMGDQTLPTGVKGKREIVRYGIMSVKNVWKSLVVIKKFRPDILYAPGPVALPWSAVCGLMTRKPVVWHLHHLFLDGGARRLLNVLGRLSAVREILAVSNCAGDQVTNARAHQKVRVLYNPIDAESYASGNASNVLAEVESALGRKITRGRTMVVTQIAAITQAKRQDRFIKVIAALKEMGKDIVGVLLGDAVSKRDQAYKKRILLEIERRGLVKEVFMPGFRRDIPDFLDLTDCLLILSEEGLSLAAMEAMCARRKVVAPDSGGAYELLSAAGCGTFYDTGARAEGIAATVCASMVDPCFAEIERGYRFCCEQSVTSYQRKLADLMVEFSKVAAAEVLTP